MPLRLMYPHAVDRYRILQKLLRTSRETLRLPGNTRPGINQTTLAKKARVSQATISMLENLEQLADTPNRHVSRETLLKVLTWGLELPPTTLDPLLWLYDGEQLREDELRHYVRSYLPGAVVQPYTDAAVPTLRQRVLALLRHALTSNPILQHTAVDVVFAMGEEQDQLRGLQAIAMLEALPGLRLVVTRYPSLLTHPPATYQSDELVPPNVQTADVWQAIRALNAQRQALFLEHLEHYGERRLLYKPALEDYARLEGCHYLSVPRRRCELTELMRLGHLKVRLDR